MPLNMPRRGETNTDPPDMVRVQLKPNDVRSYRRRDAEKILTSTPGAFILGETPAEMKGEGKNLDEAAEDFKAKAGAANKARPGAANKAKAD